MQFFHVRQSVLQPNALDNRYRAVRAAMRTLKLSNVSCCRAKCYTCSGDRHIGAPARIASHRTRRCIMSGACTPICQSFSRRAPTVVAARRSPRARRPYTGICRYVPSIIHRARRRRPCRGAAGGRPPRAFFVAARTEREQHHSSRFRHTGIGSGSRPSRAVPTAQCLRHRLG